MLLAASGSADISHNCNKLNDTYNLQNPDIVLVHYLNVPYPDDNKLAVITPSLALWADKKEWTKDELVSQLKPMFFSEDEPDLNNELEISVTIAALLPLKHKL